MRERNEDFFGGSPPGKQIVNLTPHDIKIVVGDYETVIPTSGTVARVSMTATEQHAVFDGGTAIPVFYNEPGGIEGLPEPLNDRVYLVSIVVLATTKRKDVFAPDTGPTAIRNEKGQIQAVTRLLTARKTRGLCPACNMVDDIAPGPDGLCYMCVDGGD